MNIELLKIIFIGVLIVDAFIALGAFFFAYKLLGWAYDARKQGRHDPIYFNFGMAVLFLGLWVAQWVLVYLAQPYLNNGFQAALSYILGLWVLHFFAIFSLHYPISYVAVARRLKFIYAITFSITLVFLIFPKLIVLDVQSDSPFFYLEVNRTGFLFYLIYFIFLSGYSFKILLNKHRRLGGLHRVHIRKILIGTIFAVAANIVTSLFLTTIYAVDLTLVGVIFTAAVLAYIHSILR